MTLKQNVYAVIVAIIVVGVTLFALQNFQDVDVSIPFIGSFHTKLFVVIVFSFILGFMTASFLSLILRIFSIPSAMREKRRESASGQVSQVGSGDKEEGSGKGTV